VINLRNRRCIALAQVTPGDLNVAIISQLSPPQLPLGNPLETGPVEVIALNASLGRWAVRE